MASTTRRSDGTTEISRSTRNTRNARNTASGPEAGTQAIATTTRSNSPHGSRKKRARKA